VSLVVAKLAARGLVSELERHAVKGVYWSVVQAIGGRALSFVVFVVLARLLTPADFGLIAMAAVFVALLEVLVQQGFALVITQRENLEPAHEWTAFWANLALSAVFGGALWASATWVAGLYDAPSLAPIVRWLSAVLPLRAMSTVPAGLLQRRFQFKALAVRAIFSAFAGGVAGVGAALAGWGVYALVAQQLVSALADVVLLWSAARWRPKVVFSIRHLRELWGFGMHLVGASLLGFLNSRSDNFVIAMALGEVALGYYAVAYRVLQVLTQILAKPGTMVAISAFSRMQRDPERMREAFYRSTQAASVVALPIFVGIAILAPDAVVLIFGEKFARSGDVLRVLAVVGIVQSVSHYNFAVYIGIGRPDIRLKLLFLGTIPTVIAFILVVRWGILAVAAAYVAGSYLLMTLDLIMLRRLIGLSWRRYFANFIPAASASFAMVLAIVGIMQIQMPTALNLVASVAAGAVVYIVSLYLIAPCLARELWSKLVLIFD
jgi:O-antigen/teichoic acid export membrane protein